jgi:glycosyltransferase involved in cell wall biosynthesis
VEAIPSRYPREERTRVAVVFDAFSGPSADDFRTVVESVTRVLKTNNDVVCLRASGAGDSDGLAKGVRAALRGFQPQVAVYVPSPKPPLATLRSGFSVRRCAPDANHVMVILSPWPKSKLPKSALARAFLRRLYPDKILVPSYRSLLGLARLSLHGDVLPLGVDVASFKPCSPDERSALRKQHGLDPDDFLFMLGSPLTRENLDAIRSLASIENIQLIASSTATDGPLASEIASLGIRRVAAAEHTPEIFRLADCFVFSASDDAGKVEFPMSVVASLACGIPVVSTPFGGVRDFLPEGDDLRYWTSTGELTQLARDIRSNPRVRVRSVDEFSWGKVAARIVSADT